MSKKLKPSIQPDTTKSLRITAQDTIPFAVLFDNGMLLNKRVKGVETYSLAFSLENTNYSLLKDSDKDKKQQMYISSLNALPDDITYQEILMNVPLNTQSLEETIASGRIAQDTEYDRAYIENQRNFVKNIRQNETETKMYFCLSYQTRSKADNPYAILHQNYAKISAKYAELGVKTEPLSTEQLLELFHNIYNPYSVDEFVLPPDLYKKGTNIRDYIAPSVFNFKPNDILMGDAYCRCFYVRAFAETIDDEFINEITDNEYRVVISKQIKLIDKASAERIVESRLRSLEEENQTRHKKNAESGTSYIPYELRKGIEACEQLLDQLNNSEELFEIGLYIMVSAHSKDDLINVTKSIKGICQRHHISILTATMRQEECLNSIVPMAQDDLHLTNYLLSSGVSMLLPFTYDRQFSPTGFYYGKNTVSKSPIIIDRKEDKNGNGYILGKSGSGKSMYAKLEIEDVMHQTEKDRIIVIDSEREFVPQCKAHSGTIIKISADTKNFINPFEVTCDHNQNEDTLKNKVDLILSLFECFKNADLSAQERSIISRCVTLAYKPYVNGGWRPELLPTFVDFDKVLQEQPEEEVRDLRLYLEMYITGSVNIFAHQTNVDLTNRYIDFDLRDLGANLKKAGMLIVLDFIQQQVFENFEKGLWTWLYVDEFQTFYDDATDANSCSVFFEKMFARFRKYGGLATGMTQNITNVLKSTTAISMLQNSQFVILLEQATNNLEQITRIYDLSDKQAGRLISTKRGEGILVTKNIAYPFEKVYPKNNIIYNTITTSFADKITQLELAAAQRSS